MTESLRVLLAQLQFRRPLRDGARERTALPVLIPV